VKAAIGVMVALGVTGCAAHRAPDPPECGTQAQCQEHQAEELEQRQAIASAWRGQPPSAEQRARDLDAIRREYCFKAAMQIQDAGKQLAAVKTCREEWPERADVEIAGKR